MLNRRILRIKVMQALYAYFKSEGREINNGEKFLFRSFDTIYELYIYVLAVFNELSFHAINRIEEAKIKRLPTHEDLNPNMRFVENKILKQLFNNEDLTRNISKRHVDYSDNQELFKRFLTDIKATKLYDDYMNSEKVSYNLDRDFIIDVFSEILLNSQSYIEYLDEKNVFAPDDYELVANMVIKTLRSFKETDSTETPLMPLFKDYEDDTNFAKLLFRKTILGSEEYEKAIGTGTEKWDAERIAFMDMLIMKMAICEFIECPTIPAKATMDEYIDISKDYSTPKSSTFINGVLDNVHQVLKKEGRVNKIGRGLIG